jgi:hypothetical protein
MNGLLPNVPELTEASVENTLLSIPPEPAADLNSQVGFEVYKQARDIWSQGRRWITSV